MAKNFKKTFAFIFFMIAGGTLGAFISYICEGKKGLDWLSWGKVVGISTVNVDLVVLKFPIGFTIDVTIAQIFTIALAIFIFAKTCKNL
ncbi:MAG: DUF4321 domain-containing protein [Clostridiales bacterium]|nr:DUF4321 domain-containing protein [Clostridiales bacterium]